MKKDRLADYITDRLSLLNERQLHLVYYFIVGIMSNNRGKELPHAGDHKVYGETPYTWEGG